MQLPSVLFSNCDVIGCGIYASGILPERCIYRLQTDGLMKKMRNGTLASIGCALEDIVSSTIVPIPRPRPRPRTMKMWNGNYGHPSYPSNLHNCIVISTVNSTEKENKCRSHRRDTIKMIDDTQNLLTIYQSISVH